MRMKNLKPLTGNYQDICGSGLVQLPEKEALKVEYNCDYPSSTSNFNCKVQINTSRHPHSAFSKLSTFWRPNKGRFSQVSVILNTTHHICLKFRFDFERRRTPKSLEKVEILRKLRFWRLMLGIVKCSMFHQMLVFAKLEWFIEIEITWFRLAGCRFRPLFHFFSYFWVWNPSLGAHFW